MSSTGVSRIEGIDPFTSFKAPCLVASTANITLSGAQTIDGVSVTETTPKTRVLVKDQTDQTENGIYDVYDTAWVRSDDFNGPRDVKKGTMVNIQSGTTWEGVTFRLTTSGTVIFGTSLITFEAANPANTTTVIGSATLDSYSELRAINTGQYSNGDVVYLSGDGIAGPGKLVNSASHGLTDNGGTIIVIDANWYWERDFDVKYYRAEWFGCKCDGTTDDLAAMQALCDYAADSDINVISWLGQMVLSDTLDIDVGTISLIGDIHGYRQTGSVKSKAGIIFTGGAVPVMSCNKNYCTFAGFNVENRGSATCWLELTSGSINQVFDRLFFLNTANHTNFTTAVINCLGVRLGYSVFKGIQFKGAASKFILIKDSSTTGMTPISFTERCIFESNATSGNTTVIEVDNSSLEPVHFEHCTFIKRVSSDLTIIDTTVNPTATPLFGLTVNECEIDADGAASTDRYFKLENVKNICMENNHMNCGGAGNMLCDLTNSSVSSFKGNFVKSLSHIFNADDDSVIRGVGYNDIDWSNVTGISNNPNCSFTSLTQATVVSMDAATWGPAETAQFVCDLDDSSAYTFAIDNILPQNWEPGQLFVLTIKNNTGGTVAAPLFSSGTFNTQTTPFTAPANNRQISIWFKWDGTEAVQIAPPSPDVISS